MKFLVKGKARYFCNPPKKHLIFLKPLKQCNEGLLNEKKNKKS